MKRNQTYDDMLEIKNEILYCIGNCVLGIQDAVEFDGLCQLKMAIDQGAIQIMIQALDYHTYKTPTTGIKVALDGLTSYLRHFKSAS